MKSKSKKSVWVLGLMVLAVAAVLLGSNFTFIPTETMSYMWYNNDIDPAHSYYTDDYVLSNIIEVGEYTIINHRLDYDSSTPLNWGCYQTFTVNKNGQFVGNTGITTDFIIDLDNNRLIELYNTKIDDNDIVSGMNYIRITKNTEKWSGLHMRCEGITNTVDRVFSDDAFDVTVQSPETAYFVGQYVPLDITVENKIDESYVGELKIIYDMPTFFGDVQQIQTQDVIVNKGINTYEYIIPTEKVVERFTVKVELDVKYKELSGLMKSRDVFINADDYLIGTISFEPQTIMLNPLPIVIEVNEDGTCENRYSLNPTGTYCIADELKELSCYHTGCPVVNGSEYECTSAGVCAETIYKIVYGDCPDGTNETYNAAGQKICIDEQLYETIVQCRLDTDCMDPCQGIVSECILGKCVFQGKCEVITQDEIKDIIRESEQPQSIPEIEFDNTKYYLAGIIIMILLVIIAEILRRKK